MSFIVPQIIGATVEKENLFIFLVCEVLELGIGMLLLFMAQMMCVRSQEWGFYYLMQLTCFICSFSNS